MLHGWERESNEAITKLISPFLDEMPPCPTEKRRCGSVLSNPRGNALGANGSNGSWCGYSTLKLYQNF